MLATANVTNNPDEVMRLMCEAHSIKGSCIPINLIWKVKELCMESQYTFTIETSSALSRKKSFFELHKSDLRFFNESGQEFIFEEEAEEIKNNETFLAVYFNHRSKEATVYVYFPYDGAIR